MPQLKAGIMATKNVEIVVLPRGWVFVGEVARTGTQLVITSAKNIRYFGTTRGLGQIAKDGPTEKTKLDDAGTVTVSLEQVLFTIDADASKWAL